MSDQSILERVEAVLAADNTNEPAGESEVVNETGEEEVMEEETTDEVPPTDVDEDEEGSEDAVVPKAALIDERRKRQELEAKLKELEEAKTEPVHEAKPESELTIDDWYAKDPQGTVAKINQEIARLVQDDLYGNADQIERLRDLKIELKDRYVQHVSQKQGVFMNELEKAVPDFTAKQKELTAFAQKELGYDNETLAILSNPSMVGPKSAITFIKSIAKQYETTKATKTAQEKAVRPSPTRVESPGTGVTPARARTSEQLLQDAKEGKLSWAEYIEKAGI